jgi:hypothetical protein
MVAKRQQKEISIIEFGFRIGLGLTLLEFRHKSDESKLFSCRIFDELYFQNQLFPYKYKKY